MALALALASMPACASLRSPIPAYASVEQNAVALMGAYALTLDQATALIANPATPRTVKTALAEAEKRATPAVELVKVAAVAHSRARNGETGAALARALTEAQTPAQALAALVGR
jgi:hypothetical protein